MAHAHFATEELGEVNQEPATSCTTRLAFSSHGLITASACLQQERPPQCRAAWAVFWPSRRLSLNNQKHCVGAVTVQHPLDLDEQGCSGRWPATGDQKT